MPPPQKRSRNPVDDEPAGPSKVQLKGLSWNSSHAQPAFLKNAISALSGPRPASTSTTTMNNGRPEIPTRPSEELVEGENDDSPDEWDLGDEAPTVVVLNQGKHVDRAEVDKLRQLAKDNSAPDPFASSKSTESTDALRNGGKLRLASGDRSDKSTLSSKVGTNESWEQVVQRAKLDSEMKKIASERKKIDDDEKRKKKEKDVKKEKKKQKKQVGLLSFDEQE